MNRNHIHFASGLLGENGVISGMRSSCEICIYIDLEKALKGKGNMNSRISLLQYPMLCEIVNIVCKWERYGLRVRFWSVKVSKLMLCKLKDRWQSREIMARQSMVMERMIHYSEMCFCQRMAKPEH